MNYIQFNHFLYIDFLFNLEFLTIFSELKTEKNNDQLLNYFKLLKLALYKV